MSKLYEDVKIIKECKQTEYENKGDHDEDEDCESFEFEGNFLESLDEEILFIDELFGKEQDKSSQYVSMLNASEMTEHSSLDNVIDIVESIIKKAENRFNEISNDFPPVCFDNVPKSLSEQFSLPFENIQSLCFYETFIISEDYSKDRRSSIELVPNPENINEIGSSSIMIEELENGNILIFMTQQIFVNNERRIFELLSVVNNDLKLINEKRIERKCCGGKLTEKSLQIIQDDKKIDLVKTITINEEITQWHGEVDWKKSGDFLSNGASVVMLRRLVKEKYVGCIQSYMCDINGDFSLSQHSFHPITKLMVNEKINDIQRVDQLLIFDGNGNISKNSTFFQSDTGYIIKQISSDQNFQIHINPLAEIPLQNRNLHENWEKDLQLLSLYFEEKAKRKEDLQKKITQPHVKKLLENYILALIQCKPKNILSFTLEFIKRNENVQMQILKTAERRHQHN